MPPNDEDKTVDKRMDSTEPSRRAEVQGGDKPKGLRKKADGEIIGPGLNEDLENKPRELDRSAPGRPNAQVVQLARPSDGPTEDQSLWTLIRNRTNAISFNNYFGYINEALGQNPDARESTSRRLRRDIGDLSFLGLDGFEVLRAATQFFLMHEVGLIVEDKYRELTPEYLEKRYEHQMVVDGDNSERRRRNFDEFSTGWLLRMRKNYLKDLAVAAEPKVLPYLKLIMEKLRDLPLKQPSEVAQTGDESSYGVLPSRLVGPLGLELIWSYWMEEGMVVQAHNAVTNRFQNQRTVPGPHDPLARLEIDPLRRLNNVLWGWIQNRPFLLSVRRRAYEYDHHYGVTLLGSAVGKVDGVDSRSQFISAFHNLLHLCTIFYQQDDDLTVHSDGFPLLNALRETQLVITAGAHNQYGDLPWTARVEMLMQMWMFARPEMREFLGGRIMVPYKEPWMDRVDTVKSAMGWTDVNVTHFRDLATFGEQIMLSIRYGSWATEIEPLSATNWARYFRPEIQGYIHAYRAATGVDLRSSVDTTMPGILLQRQLDQRIDPASRAAIGPARNGASASRAAARNVHELT